MMGVTKAMVCVIPSVGMVHINDPLLLIGSNPCGAGSECPVLLSEWFSSICPTPHNRKIKCAQGIIK